MRISIDFGAVEISDSRGNRLLRYQLNGVAGSGEKRLYLYAHPATARQIEWAFQSLGCRRIELTETQRANWSHRYRLRDLPDRDGRAFLELMKEVLTLNVHSDLDCAIALDFYKDPSSHEDPNQWANTPTGELIGRGKYAGFAKEGQELAGKLASVVARHPIYRAADAIVMVPSSKNKFGERLAEVVAKTAGKPFIRTSAAHLTRPEAKNANDDDRADLSHEFTIPEEHARGRVLIVVDDVYKTGGTMRAVAGAAHAAGAAAVLGLVGARTMRKGGGG